MKKEKKEELKKFLVKDCSGKFELTDDFLEEDNKEGNEEKDAKRK